jgi:mRNA-degrading endonuclease YafQ of YafQ-DinJ toxin-antitoxin module
MKTVRVTGAFKKDLKRVVRRGYDQGLIELIIDQLRSDLPLHSRPRRARIRSRERGRGVGIATSNPTGF